MRLKTPAGTLGLLALFSLAFGYEEATVVLYLRRLSFPAGPPNTLHLEAGREAATLVALAVLAWLSGRDAASRIRGFFFAFGLWDIAYYAWLFALSGSPTLFSTDVLFLLPAPWVAPVWSAAAFALLLVAAGIAGLKRGRTLFFVAALAIGFLSFIAQGIGIAHAYPVPLFALGVVVALWALDIPLPNATGAR